MRVHVTAVFRDLIGTTIEGHASWSFDASLRAIAEADAGVLVLLSKPETAEDGFQVSIGCWGRRRLSSPAVRMPTIRSGWARRYCVIRGGSNQVDGCAPQVQCARGLRPRGGRVRRATRIGRPLRNDAVCQVKESITPPSSCQVTMEAMSSVSAEHGDVDGLLGGAMQALRSVGITDNQIRVVTVPGAFEIPLACKAAAARSDCDAVIALGAVIRGGTPHFEYVAGECTRGIGEVASIRASPWFWCADSRYPGSG